MSGTDRIAEAFRQARQAGRTALMPYYTLGYPDRSTAEDVIAEIAASGADLIELGVPFSDPLADGPTIQRSTQTALAAGASVPACLASVKTLRARGVQTPLLLMGYINPILSYGVERFAHDAAAAGADGLIVPDLPPEEAAELESACRKRGLAWVCLVSPASTGERLRLAAGRSTGFVYLVSVLGVTGAREQLAADLEGFVRRVRACTDLPLALGFGISTPAQAAQAGRLVDGVIVGSALINVVSAAADARRSSGEFVAALRAALG